MVKHGHGRGSTKPANIKLRPVLPEEERAKPRNKGTVDARKTLRHVNNSSSSETEDEDEQEQGNGEECKASTSSKKGIGRLYKDQDSKKKQTDDVSKSIDVQERRPLHEMIVCLTGETQVPRSDARKMTESLGGIFESALTLDTTFLIADRTEGDKYRAAVDNGIPVLHSQFLKALHREWLSGNTDIDIIKLSEKMRLTPLHSLKICLTGYDASVRDTLRNTIVQTGGADYSGTFDHTVTHLVIGPEFERFEEWGDLAENGKVRAARQINQKRAKSGSSTSLSSASVQQGGSAGKLHIVWGEWLEHSLIAFGRMREESYTVDIVKERSMIPPVNVTRTEDIITRANSPKKKDTRGNRKSKILRQGTVQNLSNAEGVMQGSSKDGLKRMASKTDILGAAGKKRSKLHNSSLMEEDDMMMIKEDNEQDDRLEVAQIRKERSMSAAPVDPSSSKIAPSQSSSSKPGLKRSKSLASAEVRRIQDLLAQPAGSSQLPSSNKANAAVPAASTATPTTSSSSSWKKGKKRALPSETTAPDSATTVSSIFASKPTGSVLSKFADRTSKFTSSASTSTSTSASTSSSFSLPTESNAPSSTSSTAKKSASQLFASVQVLPASLPQPTTTLREEGEDVVDDDEPPLPIFQDKKFLIVFPGIASHIISAMKIAIEERAGSIVEEDGPDVDYVMCKFIKDTAPEWNLQDPRLVTELWLEQCIAFDEIWEDHPDSLKSKKPLRIRLPNENLHSMLVSFSGFDEVAMKHLKRFADAIGLKHETCMRKGATTHLVIPDAEYKSAKRLGTAHEWGVKTIFPRHLRELVEARSFSSDYKQEGMPVIASTDHEIQDHHVEVKEETEMQPLEPVQPVKEEEPEQKIIRSGPLVGCNVCVSSKVERVNDLRKLADSLGANVVYSVSEPRITHFIYQSKKAKDGNKEFRLAQEAGRYIVHPSWLVACSESGMKQPEIAYKHTLDTTRSLSICVESVPSQVQQKLQPHPQTAPAELTMDVDGELEEDDEFRLPPALRANIQIPPPPSMQNIKQSTPRAVRAPVPASPPRNVHRSSSATENPSPRQDASRNSFSAPPPDFGHNQIDDSGFVPSSGKRKTGPFANPSSPSSASSPQSRKLQRLDSNAENVSLGTSESDDPSLQLVGAPTSTAITRDLLAEMNALMEADMPQHLGARLPYQQNGFARPQRRLPQRKAVDGNPGSSPNRSKPVSFLEAGLLARQQAGYDNMLDSQLGGPHGRHAYIETQDQSPEQNTMVIRMNDPMAEATKAQLLAGIRNLQHKDSESTGKAGPAGNNLDNEETEQTFKKRTRSTMASSSRSMH